MKKTFQEILFDKTSDSHMLFSYPEFKFILASPTTWKMFGYEVENDYTIPPWSFSPEKQPCGRSSLEMAQEHIQETLREGCKVFSWTHRRKNGEDFLASVSLNRVEIEGTLYVYAMIQDISKMEDTEKVKFIKKLIMEQCEKQLMEYLGILDFYRKWLVTSKDDINLMRTIEERRARLHSEILKRCGCLCPLSRACRCPDYVANGNKCSIYVFCIKESFEFLIEQLASERKVA